MKRLLIFFYTILYSLSTAGQIDNLRAEKFVADQSVLMLGAVDSKLTTWGLYLKGTIYYHGKFNKQQDYFRAVEYFQKATKSNFAPAQEALATCYLTGNGISQNCSTAIKLYTLAAQAGYAPAQWNLGNCYYAGIGVAKDISMAMHWYKRAAIKEEDLIYSDLDRNFFLYDHGLEDKKDRGTLRWYQTANTELLTAYLNMASYYDSESISNYTEAIRYYLKAAELGDVNAQNNLGTYCYEGKGTKQDYAEAVKWYRKAAEQGNAFAQKNLGICYEDGQGVGQSYAEAAKWYRKAAEQGNATAQHYLGVCYEYGKGVGKSYAEAVKWYRKAAEQGNTTAQYNLGICYYDGHGVGQNYAEAVKLYRKAAEQKHMFALGKLGICYYKGKGVTKNPAEAFQYLSKAAPLYEGAQIDFEVWVYLSKCYRFGYGTPVNEQKAEYWLKKVIDTTDEEERQILQDFH